MASRPVNAIHHSPRRFGDTEGRVPSESARLVRIWLDANEKASLRPLRHAHFCGSFPACVDAYFADNVLVMQRMQKIYRERPDSLPSKFFAEPEQVQPEASEHEYFGV